MRQNAIEFLEALGWVGLLLSVLFVLVITCPNWAIYMLQLFLGVLP